MKACVIQPPYSMEYANCDACFAYLVDSLKQCDSSMDLIVLPEYSDVPSKADTWEEAFSAHEKHIDALLTSCRETAKRCAATVFVNALSHESTGYRNTTYCFDKNGNLAGKYFKRHLPPSELYTYHLDSAYTRTFEEPYVLTVDGVRYGFLTCYDFYFYEAYAALARQNVDVIIGCSLQRTDSHNALSILGKFVSYHCNAYLVRASVSLGEDSEVGGCSMVVSPKGDMLLNMESRVGMETVMFNPHDKYYKPAGFGGREAAHYAYIEDGRNPWQYRPAGPAICMPDSIMPYPRVCAHRGFSKVAPENSMPAYGAAVAMGAEEIEFDLWYTKDGEIVSIHDPTLHRVSNGEGFVYEHTLQELKELDFGSKFSEDFKGLKIMTFEEILQKFACHTIMNIHIKATSDFVQYDREIMKKIIALIDKYDCRKYVYFMSSNDSVLALGKELAPDIVRCVGYQGGPEDMIPRALKYDCKKIQLFKPYFDENLVKEAHKHGIICNVFFSDWEEETRKYLAMGIDTILSNHYNRVSQVVAAYPKYKGIDQK